MFIGQIAAGEVIDFRESALHQDPRGEIAAMSGAAEDHDLLPFGDLVQAFAQLVHLDIDRAVDRAQLVFIRGANVDQHCVCIVQIAQFVPVNDLHQTGEDVVRHQSCHVDRVFGRGEGRRVGVLDLFQIIDAFLVFEDMRHHVDALIHSVKTHDLRAQQSAVGRIEDDLDGHWQGVRIVTRVGRGMDDRGYIGDVFVFEHFLGNPGGSDRELKDFGDRGLDRAHILAFVAQHHIIRGNASLFVGRTCQIGEERLSGDGAGEDDGISHRVDQRIGGLQVFIDHDAFVDAQFQPGILCQFAIRTHPDREQHQIRLQRFSALEPHVQTVGFPHKRIHRVFEIKFHALGLQMLMNLGCHFIIQRGHDLLRHLHDSHEDAQMMQVFSHFQTDEAGTHDHRALHIMTFDIGLDPVGIGNAAQGEDLRFRNAGNARTQRLCTRGKQQLVVRLGIFLAGLCFFDRDGFGRAVYPHDLGIDADIHIQPGFEALRALHKQPLPFTDHSPHVIGQATIGIRDIRTPFKHDDFRAFIHPPQPGSSGSSARDSSND